MDFFQLYCFIAVCKSGSFTAAADELFIAQSTVSKRVAQLESEMGVTLLCRSKRNVTPTPAGQYFYDHISSLLESYEGILAETTRIARGKTGRICIGIGDNLDLNRLLPGFLLDFSEAHKDLEIKLTVDGHYSLYEQLWDRKADIIFIPSTHGDPGTSVQLLPINRGQSQLYFSSKHRLTGRPNLTVEDFKEDTLYVLAPKSGNAFFSYLREAYTPIFRQVIAVDSISTLEQYVGANLGVTILGPSQNFFYSSTIKNIPANVSSSEVGTDALWLTENENPALTHFRVALSRYLKQTI